MAKKNNKKRKARRVRMGLGLTRLGRKFKIKKYRL